MAKKKVISIHIKDGQVKDVAGIPSDVKVIITYVDSIIEDEVSFTSKDNIQ